MALLRRPRTAAITRGVIAAVLLVAVALGIGVVARHHGDGDASRPARVAAHTVPVVRKTLQNVVTASGTIGYVGPRPLRGSGTGVLTELPHVGAVTERGATLYRADDQPVAVFYGTTPLFRPIDHIGITGADVYVVAENLHRLGWFDGFLPDDPHDAVFSRTLHIDLKHWQRSIGATPTGTLRPGQVAVLPGRLRVAKVSAALGDPAAEQVAVLTGTDKIITGAGPADLVDGSAVVTLPDGSTSPGRVTVSGGIDENNQLAFTVRPTDPAALRTVDSGAVTVAVTTQIRRNVLVVPIVALLALQGGSRYAVELPDGRLIAVRTGMFTSDSVEISGAGLRPGLSVVSAS